MSDRIRLWKATGFHHGLNVVNIHLYWRHVYKWIHKLSISTHTYRYNLGIHVYSSYLSLNTTYALCTSWHTTSFSSKWQMSTIVMTTHISTNYSNKYHLANTYPLVIFHHILEANFQLDNPPCHVDLKNQSTKRLHAQDHILPIQDLSKDHVLPIQPLLGVKTRSSSFDGGGQSPEIHDLPWNNMK